MVEDGRSLLGKAINQSFCYSTILTSVFSNSLKLPGSFYYIVPKTVSNLIKVPLLTEKMLFGNKQ